MDIDPTTVDEDSSTIMVNISLINATNTESRVTFKTVDGTAISTGATRDFVAKAQLIRLGGPLPTTTKLTIVIVNDATLPVREGPETFKVQLSNASTQSGGTSASVIAGADQDGVFELTATIDDDQDKPRVSVSDPQPVGEDAGEVEFTITLTGRTMFSSTVDYATADNTSTHPALAGADYTAKGGSLTFGPSPAVRVVTMNVKVEVLEDEIDEFSETFDLEVVGTDEAVTNEALIVSDGTGVGTIDDNDDAPVLSISPVEQSVGEGDGGGAGEVDVSFTVSLSGGSSEGVTVLVETDPLQLGTATKGSDYESTTNQFVWAPDEVNTTRTYTVTVFDDAIEHVHCDCVR